MARPLLRIWENKPSRKEWNRFTCMEVKLEEFWGFKEALPSSLGQVTLNIVSPIRRQRREDISADQLGWFMSGVGSEQVSSVSVKTHRKSNGKNNTLKHVLGTESLEKQFSKYFRI